jgi:hypothetical protein
MDDRNETDAPAPKNEAHDAPAHESDAAADKKAAHQKDEHEKDEPPPPIDRVDHGGAANAAATPKPACYDDAVLEPADDPLGIKLCIDGPHAAPTSEMRDLVRDVFAVERVIRVLFGEAKYKKARKRFFELLLTTTRIGLCGPDYDVEAGRLDLALTQDEIADAFPTLRDELWKSYFTIVGLFTLIFGPLGCVLYYHLTIKHAFSDHNTDLLAMMPALPQICIALVWIPFGVSLGIFLEFVFRMGENVTYDGLLAINPGRWKPWRRTASTLITAYVFAFIVGVGAFQIGIGSILLNDFISTRPWLSVAIGFVTGFTFPYVRDIVTQFKPERRDAAPPTGDAGGAQAGGKKK